MEFIKKHRRLILLISIAIFLLIIGLVIVLLNIKPGQIALSKLEGTFNGNNLCHEQCYILRQNQEKIIVAGYSKNSKILNQMILNYWQSPTVSLEFKTELVKLSRMIYGADNAPDFLKNYILDPAANLNLVEEIISQFNLNSDNLSTELINKIKNASSIEQKIEILKTLSKIGNDSGIDNYFSLLISGEEIKVKLEVIKNISNIKEKSVYFTIAQLATIKNLIFAPDTDISLRQDLVLLIGDYYLVYPDQSLSLWREIYDNKSLDNISLSFSADNLNHLAKTKLILPTVSPGEWNTYYNK